MTLDAEKVREALAGFPRRRLPTEGCVQAAVLLTFFEKAGEDHLLFTRRAESLDRHKGEISFPGGEREAHDPDLCATALRETREEIGLLQKDVDILGRLDDFQTLFGFHVTPFVGTFAYPYDFVANDAEVAEILEIPLRDLVDPGAFHYEDRVFEGQSCRVGFFTLDSLVIWGLTGGILKQFLDVAAP